MKWFVIIFILAIVLVAGCTQTPNQPLNQTPTSNNVKFNEVQNLYIGVCYTNNSGLCEVKPYNYQNTKIEGFNSSFNYTIFLLRPISYYKYYYTFKMMNGDKVYISEGLLGSDSETLTINDVLCSNKGTSYTVKCPIPTNTEFMLVNVTKNLVNSSATIDPFHSPDWTYQVYDSTAQVNIITLNGENIYSNSCNFSQGEQCSWSLDASIASKIQSSKIIIELKRTYGSLMSNSSEFINIDGIAYFSK